MVSSLSHHRRPASAVDKSHSEEACQDSREEKEKKTSLPCPFPINLLDGLGGTIHGSFFQTPRWVDVALPPGTTSQAAMYAQSPNWLPMFTGKGLLYSPNLIWLIIALGIYLVFPYDMQKAKEWDRSFITQRLAIHGTLVLSYFGFWHVALYGLGGAQRPFVLHRTYQRSKVLHNLWYTILAVLQWTLWEATMVHLYATGRIGYQEDKVSFGGSLTGWASFVAGCILVPVYRDFHFFVSHRFLHHRFLYKYVHALHHRNTDVEPFAGLAMSPVEHLYYFSCVGPSLYLYKASPFVFLWNGVHLLLSPAAPHSGWEDHWQSQQFHAVHHRYFECNYGTPGVPFDRWFGTFRESMAPSKVDKQGNGMTTSSSESCPNIQKDDAVVVSARSDDKATLWGGLPAWDVLMYNAATWIGIPWWIRYALAHREDDNPRSAVLVALYASLGPISAGVVLLLITSPRQSWRYTYLYPFHKEALMWGSTGICFAAGIVMVLMPVYHIVHALLVPDPSQTIYHFLWG